MCALISPGMTMRPVPSTISASAAPAAEVNVGPDVHDPIVFDQKIAGIQIAKLRIHAHDRCRFDQGAPHVLRPPRQVPRELHLTRPGRSASRMASRSIGRGFQ